MRFSQSIKRMGALGVAGPGLMAIVLLGMLSGCDTTFDINKGFFDPSEMGRFQRTALTVKILKNLDTGIEETDERFATATNVKSSDLVASNSDYVVGPNDLIQISILGLLSPDVETTKQTRVSQSGFISLPLVGQVKAAGLTEAQLEQAIVQAYRDANYIQNAQVSVVTIEARNRTFSILGAVTQPGQYAILDANFRLLDALVLARDVNSQTGIDYIYIVRQKSQDTKEAPGEVPATETAPAATQPAPANLAPRSAAPQTNPPRMMMDSPEIAATAPSTAPAGGAEGRIIVVDEKPMQIEGGKTVPEQQGAAPTTNAAEQTGATAQASEKGFEFNDLREPSDVRVIRVPFEDLKRGEFRYNVVIHPQDLIIVPQPVIGEYYMGGHVSRTGVYSLSARNITLTQAVIAAGMLDQLAIPSRTEIRRRLSPTREVLTRVDLDKIFAGEEPDILLKPDDQVMVGTNAIAPFLAAFRSGFRLTYGFGFLYDRNYWNPMTR